MKYITAILCLLFILAGCSNITAPSGDRQDERSLKISVSADIAGSRTLYPKAFTKYVISFSGSAANSLAPITLENGQTSTVVNASSLGTGNLTITAKGYALINSQYYEAAEGSATINISSGSLPSTIIYLNADMDMSGPNGFFTYSVSFPSSLVNYGYLEIRNYNGGAYEQRFLSNNDSDTIELAPGYYLMKIWLDDGYNKVAGITEIVHIYSNMETKAEYSFTENDFVKYITLSGTIDVKVDGQVPWDVRLCAYLDENYQNYLTETWVDTSTKTWTMRVAAFDDEIPLYFSVRAYSGSWFNRDIGLGVRAKDENKSGINLAPVNFNVITVSGTVNIQVDGATPQYAYVNVYNSLGNYLGDATVNLQDRSWSWKGMPFDNDTTLSFRVGVNIDGSGFSQETRSEERV
jgi:hypothetical protein